VLTSWIGIHLVSSMLVSTLTSGYTATIVDTQSFESNFSPIPDFGPA